MTGISVQSETLFREAVPIIFLDNLTDDTVVRGGIIAKGLGKGKEKKRKEKKRKERSSWGIRREKKDLV